MKPKKMLGSKELGWNNYRKSLVLRFRELSNYKGEDLIVQLEIKIQAVKIEDNIVIIHLQIEIYQCKIKEPVLM